MIYNSNVTLGERSIHLRKKFPKLTNSESEMMEVLWKASRPLTSSKIVALSEGQTWKPSYVHILINSLLKKEMIEVAGFEQSTKNYARTFQPTMSRDEYIAGTVQETMSESAISALFAAFVDTTADEALIDELFKKLEQRKKELESKEDQEN